MRRHRLNRCARRLAAIVPIALTALAALPVAARERVLLDADWRFSQSDFPAPKSGAPAPVGSGFDDDGWRTVHLPHDWSIETAPAADQPARSNGGYFPTGVGWYRRSFITPANWNDQRVAIEFEGVYHRSTVWLNGHELGKHAYGYTPFSFDLTPHLKPAGEPNVLAVRVDNSAQPNCRWYSGSGIYRHVWLEATDKLHLVRDNLIVSATSWSPDSASVQIRTTVKNGTDAEQNTSVELELFDPDGTSIFGKHRSSGRIGRGIAEDGNVVRVVRQPQFWTPDHPELYRLVERVLLKDQVVDELSTPIGIRTVKVTPERGFELNGEPLELFGGCVHHDNGPLGAAAFDRAETRRVEILKAAGFNAIRTSHNPPSTAFLDACDRLGMLVIDEAFDGWAEAKKDHDYHEDFAANWKNDVEAMVRRDRNHPSVVMWSIGNEMAERGKPSGAKIAVGLRAAVLALDATRPITAACNGIGGDDKWPGVDPVFAALDVAGYNYELDRIEPDHERLPNRVMQITESFQSEAFAAWDLVQRHPYLIGEFLWTAMDYLGEAGIGRVWAPGEQVRQHWEGEHFPWIGAYCGDIDVTGHRKAISHYRNIIWDRGERLYAAVAVAPPEDGKWGLTLWSLPPMRDHWDAAGGAGAVTDVHVYSRYPSVRLYLNDKRIGEQPTGRDQQFRAISKVSFAPGEVRAAGVDESGQEVETYTVHTPGKPKALRLTVDRSTLVADGQDLAFVTSEIIDEHGRVVPASMPAKFAVTGPATIAAMGNGAVSDATPFNANPRAHYDGRALVVLRTKEKLGDKTAPSEIVLTAEAEGLEPASITITSTGP